MTYLTNELSGSSALAALALRGRDSGCVGCGLGTTDDAVERLVTQQTWQLVMQAVTTVSIAAVAGLSLYSAMRTQRR